MAILLRIPRLYPEMEEATIGRWMAAEGASLESGAPVVEIITEKVAYEVESPESDETIVLLAICAGEKSVLPVESVLAVVGRPGETEIPDWKSENARIAQARRAQLPAQAATPPSQVAGPKEEVEVAPAGVIRATPAARRAAKAAGVSLEAIAATTSAATITETDVARYLETRP